MEVDMQKKDRGEQMELEDRGEQMELDKKRKNSFHPTYMTQDYVVNYLASHHAEGYEMVF